MLIFSIATDIEELRIGQESVKRHILVKVLYALVCIFGEKEGTKVFEALIRHFKI
ncbi:MAG: hypothetical protein OSJ27_08725 [Candidatus Gastranaerophilales bacterium]|nr:hypothetical protein [Candidatus Gastranaerophilales bacterium]